MSVDGPYKSLQMPRHWRKVAERADKQAYSADEVREALRSALEKDCHQGRLPLLCGKLKAILGRPQGNLFGDDPSDRLEALRMETAGSPLAHSLLNYALQSSADGHKGHEALLRAAENLITDRAVRGERQVEEHYRRKSKDDRAIGVKRRLQEAREGTDMRKIAARLMGLDNTEPSADLAKKTGLDDGISL